ncbi:helix-turn-helix transcriptional regulator [Enterovibrio norvegicus]|uniref:helix-turn-helix transcriptional regulator n=1 Tax=Enterovibrio norvegicus TaxID=188144 RepID=UPI00352EE3BF
MTERNQVLAIAQKIKLARGHASKTQVQMAKKLEVARQTYLDIESGKTEPRITTLKIIAAYTKFPLMWFLEENGDSIDYQRAKESVDVIEFLSVISKLPDDARVELLGSTRKWATILMDQKIKNAVEV